MSDKKLAELQDYLVRKSAEELATARAANVMDDKLIHDCYGRAFKLSAKWLQEAIAG